MEQLRVFNGDMHTKQALLEYLQAYFEQKIIERAMKKQDVTSLADAIIELQNGFDQLQQDYGIPTKPKQPENTSR